VAGQATVDGIELGTGTTAILPAAIVPEIVCEASSDAILLEIGLPQGKLTE